MPIAYGVPCHDVVPFKTHRSMRIFGNFREFILFHRVDNLHLQTKKWIMMRFDVHPAMYQIRRYSRSEVALRKNTDFFEVVFALLIH